MRFYLLIISFSILTGCGLISAKPNTNYDKSLSEAMNIARLGGITNPKRGPVVDTPYKDIEKALINNSQKGDVANAIPIALAGAKLSGAMAATSGISSGFGGGLMLLRSLTTSDRIPSLNDGLIAWMPLSYAADKKEAAKKMKEILRSAYLKALPSNTSSRFEMHTKTATFGAINKYPRDVIKGGDCDFIEDECQLVISASPYPHKTKQPAWLGHEDSYFWTFSKDPAYAWAKVIKNKPRSNDFRMKTFGVIQTREYIQKATSFLPEWIFIYDAPNKDKNENYPVIFNQGKALYFIEPKPTTEQALNN